MPPLSNRHHKVFISYRNVPLSQRVGESIANHLHHEYGFEVFIDTQKLRDLGGEQWAEAIYENVRSSDVLIVLLEPGTSESNWVQREIDVARGALVAVIPIVIVPDAEIRPHIGQIQHDLAISSLQYLLFDPDNPNYPALQRSIQRRVKETRDDQTQWQRDLADRRRVKPAERNDPFYAVYRLHEAPDLCRVCLAAGDMTRLPNIDVLVNTENNYMFMARTHENLTLSAALRREGSWIEDGRILDDAVQRQLDQAIANTRFRSRPVELEQVIITPAGHPEGQLVRNGARYIFHAATVRVHPTLTEPIYTEHSIQRVVYNCLNAFRDVDRKQGVISPPGTEEHQTQQQAAATYADHRLTSIAFPTFGTGRGGRPVIDVLPNMIHAFRSYLLEQRTFFTQRPDYCLHLVLLSQPDLDDAQSLFADPESGFTQDG
jgi:O-acetyl-ADP-ribose deacetylase (regulator of RNase III)